MQVSSRKQHILEAAARLFRDRGYVGTSMRDLAQAVDLQASSLYNHIESKQHILREICFANADRYAKGMDRIESTCERATDRVEALIRLHLDIATQDFTSITAFNDEWRHLDEPYLAAFKERRRNYETRFRAVIQQGIESGEFKPIDTTAALYTILSAMRWVYDWYHPGRESEVANIERTICRLVLNGLAK